MALYLLYLAIQVMHMCVADTVSAWVKKAHLLLRLFTDMHEGRASLARMKRTPLAPILSP